MTPCMTVIDAHNVVECAQALIIQTKKGSTWSANFFFFFYDIRNQREKAK